MGDTSAGDVRHKVFVAYPIQPRRLTARDRMSASIQMLNAIPCCEARLESCRTESSPKEGNVTESFAYGGKGGGFMRVTYSFRTLDDPSASPFSRTDEVLAKPEFSSTQRGLK